MIKMIFLCWRREGIGHGEYAEMLLRDHVPIALRHHPTLRQYVVNIVERTPAGERELDSVGELWFDGLEDYRQRLYDSLEGEAVVQRDVQRFLGGASAYVTREHVQKGAARPTRIGERSPGLKWVCPVMRRQGMSHEEFVDHWLSTHVPLARKHHPGMSRYVTNVVEQRLSPDGDDWDGFAELHFPSEDAVRNGLFDSPEGERIVREDIARFIGRTGAYWVAEYVEKTVTTT